MVVDNFDLVCKIQEAIQVIKRGICKRVDVNENVKVYAVKDIIRIDIKEV